MSIAKSALLVSLLLVTTSSQALPQDAVRLQRVMLSAAGVGFLDFAATVDAEARIELSVPKGQADDILKSLTIYSDAGKLGAVTIGGEMAPAELFRDLPIQETDLVRPAALLTKLKGAKIRVDGPRVIIGRMLAVENEETRFEQGMTVRHRVSVMTAEGLRSFILEEVSGVRFEETQTNAMLETALGRLAAARADGDRQVQIRVDAPAGSQVRLGYLVEAPLWKTSYRVVLGTDQARLQAWAIVDNRSGIDWRDIELTLVSGSPVTLKQALAKVYLVDRPEVPVRLAESLRPRVDPGAMAPRPEAPKRSVARAMAAAPQSEVETAVLAAQAESVPSHDMAAIEAPQVSEGTTQTIYRLPGAVTLPDGSTAMLPLTDRQLPAERVALFQPDRHKTSPLAALRVKNDTSVTLPRGLLTIYESDATGRIVFQGDAELAGLSPGEARLLPYALDAKTRVRVERTNAQRLTGFKLVNGVLTIRSVDQLDARYRVEAPLQEQRILVIEHLKSAGFTLVGPVAESETDRFWRFERPLSAGSKLDLEVVEERQRSSEMALLGTSIDELRVVFHGQEIPKPLQDAMARIAVSSAEVGAAESEVARLENERTALVEDQGRLRANFGSVPKDSDLAKRYLDRLAKSEDRLEALGSELELARSRVAERRAALEALVQRLEI